jgi:hypothetical protein
MNKIKSFLLIGVASVTLFSQKSIEAMNSYSESEEQTILFRSVFCREAMEKAVKNIDDKNSFYKIRIQATKVGKKANRYCPGLMVVSPIFWWMFENGRGFEFPSKIQTAVCCLGLFWDLFQKSIGDCLQREEISMPKSRDMKVMKLLLMGGDENINAYIMEAIIGTEEKNIPIPACILKDIKQIDFSKDMSGEDREIVRQEINLLSKFKRQMDSIKQFKPAAENLKRYIQRVKSLTEL